MNLVESSATGQQALLPHPFIPLNLIQDREASRKNRPQPQWAQMRNRRARILATARQILASAGSDQLTIKNIALSAELSVPTIYNLIGTRHEVLVHAMNDYTIALGKTAQTPERYPHFILALADLYAYLAANYPDFIRSSTKSYFSGDVRLYGPWHECGVRMITTSLQNSLSDGLLRPGTDPGKIARRSSSIISTTMYEWAIGTIEDQELREELLSAACDFLIRSFVPHAAEELDNWLSSFLREEVHP